MIQNANWISPSFNAGDGAAEFVKGFTVGKNVVSAVLTVTAIGVYDAYLKGKRVGDFILAPGCTAYNKQLQYQTYDISEMLCDNNEIVITVGKGWHRSRMSENRPEINTKPCALIAEIEITYGDGTKGVIQTDEKWSARKSKVIFNDIWDGETYDATLDTDEKYSVNVVELEKDILIGQEGEIVCEQDVLYPKELIVTPKGEKVIDFGQEITGYVEFTVNAKKGEKVELSCAEVMDKDGNFYTANYRSAKSNVTYICCDGEQTYKPRFTFYGFRYIRLDKLCGGNRFNKNSCCCGLFRYKA